MVEQDKVDADWLAGRADTGEGHCETFYYACHNANFNPASPRLRGTGVMGVVPADAGRGKAFAAGLRAE